MFYDSYVKTPTASFKEKSKTTFPSGKVEEKETETKAGGGVFKGDAAKKLKIGKVQVDKAGAKTDPSTFEQWKQKVKGKEVYILYGACGLVMVVGCVLGYYAGSWKLSVVICAGAGAGMGTIVLFEEYPWVVLLPVAFFIAAGVFLLWHLARGKSIVRTLGVVTGALEDLEDDDPRAAKAAKKNIRRRAGSKESLVKRDITVVKRKLRI